MRSGRCAGIAWRRSSAFWSWRSAIGANTAVFSVVHAVLLNAAPLRPSRTASSTLTYLSTGGNASGNRSRQVSRA